MGPNPIQLPLEDEEVGAQMAQREDHVKTQGDDSHLQAKERGLEQILPTEGTKPAHTLISDFLPLEERDSTFLWFKPPSVGYFVTAARAN